MTPASTSGGGGRLVGTPSASTGWAVPGVAIGSGSVLPSLGLGQGSVGHPSRGVGSAQAAHPAPGPGGGKGVAPQRAGTWGGAGSSTTGAFSGTSVGVGAGAGAGAGAHTLASDAHLAVLRAMFAGGHPGFGFARPPPAPSDLHSGFRVSGGSSSGASAGSGGSGGSGWKEAVRPAAKEEAAAARAGPSAKRVKAEGGTAGGAAGPQSAIEAWAVQQLERMRFSQADALRALRAAPGG